MLRCLIGGILVAALSILAAGCSRQTCQVEEPRPIEVDPLTESFQVYTQVDFLADADFMVVVEYEVPIEAQLVNDPGRPTGGRTIGRNIRATAQLQSEHQ